MTNYVVYIHRPTALVPEMRVVNVDSIADLPDAIRDTAHEWPAFDCIDIYDEEDMSVMRVVAGGLASTH